MSKCNRSLGNRIDIAGESESSQIFQKAGLKQWLVVVTRERGKKL